MGAANSGQHRPIARFGFGGLSLLVGLVVFAVQQFYTVAVVPPSWKAALVYLLLASALIVVGIWSWDRSAELHWAVKLCLSLVVVGIVGGVGYGPIRREYMAEHHSFAAVTESTPARPENHGASNIQLEFVGQNKLQFLYYANSDESANEPKHFFGLWDINRPFYNSDYPGVPQALPLAWKTDMDFRLQRYKARPDGCIGRARCG